MAIRSKVQIIDSLLQEVTKFKMTDDSGLVVAREWLSDKIDIYRATLIKRIIAERGSLSSAYQKIECLKPECIEVNCEIEGVSVKASSRLWKVKVPDLLDVPGGIKYFGLVSLTDRFEEIDFNALANYYDKWKRGTKQFARLGGYIYYQDFDGTRVFTLIALASNPDKVCGYKDTDPYSLGSEHEAALELLIKKDLYPMQGIPIDELNDTRDNPSAGGTRKAPTDNAR